MIFTSLKFSFAIFSISYYKQFSWIWQVINVLSKNVTNFLLNQLKNVVHPYSYDLSNCYGTWYPFTIDPNSFVGEAVCTELDPFFTFMFLVRLLLFSLYKLQLLVYKDSFAENSLTKIYFFDYFTKALEPNFSVE